MKPKAALRHFLALAGSSLLAVSSASAATRNWDGDTDADWGNSANWDTLPTSDLTTDIANFNLATYGGNPVWAPTVGTATSINGITIGALNGTMTLTTGGFLDIGNSGISIANGAGAFTISGSTTLGSDQTWINNSVNNFTFGAVSNGANLLTISGTGNTIATGDIGSGSSSGGLTKQGSGRLTLQAASTRTGATVIDGGTLRIENATAFGTTAAAITINNGGIFEIGTTTALAATTSTGTINLNNGGTILNGLAGGAARIDKTINLQASATGVFTFNSGSNASNVLTINGGANSRLAGGATGAQIQITGSGIVDVGETGQTRTTAVIADWYLQGGRLRIRADGEIGNAANDFYFQGGTLLTDGAFTLGTSRVLNFNHASGGTVDTTGGNLTLGTAGQLNGANRLTKAGSNSLIISANNTGFSGGVTLNGGIVQVNSAQALGTSGNLTFTGGTLQYTASSAAGDDYSARIKNSSSAIILDSNGQTISLAGIIDNTNVAGLTKTGTGTVQLSGANTYTGTTTLTQGTLSLDFTGGSNRINSGNALTFNGGTLQFTNLGTNTQTFGTTTLIVGTASSITRSGTWTSGVSDLGTLTGSGSLDVSNLSGSPSWIMASGNASQTYLLNGQVTANSGASFVRTDASGNLLTVATSDFANNAIIGDNDGTSIRLVTGGSVGTGPTGSGFVGLSTAGTTDFDSILNRYTTGTVTIDVTNSGANASNILRLGSYGPMSSTFGASLTIGADVANGGVLTAGGADNTAGTIYVNGSNNTTINSAIQNNGTGVVGLNKDGSGTLTLAGTNTFTGGTTVNGGTLLATTTSTSLTPQSPLGAGAITLNGSGTILQLRASGTLSATAETIQFNNNVTVGGNATINVDRPGATSTTKTIQLGTLNIGANTLGVTGANNYALRFNGATTLTGNATFDVSNIYNNNPSLTLAGAVGDGSADYSLTKTGAGMLALSGTNTFSGGVFINAGTLQVASTANLGDSANVVTFTGNSNVSFSSGATLSQGFAINAGVTGTLNVSNATVTINNSLAGSGTLVASGGSTGGGYFTFTSTNNTFSGNIEINSSSGGSYSGGLTLASLDDTPGTRIKMSNTSSFTYGVGAVVPLVFNNRQIESIGWEFGSTLNNNATNTSSTVTVNTDLILSGGGSGQYANRPFTLGGSNTGNNTFAGAITNGAGYVTRLTKAGVGTWVLTNANTYTGGTILTAGNLQVGVNSVGSVGSITSSAVGTGTLTFNGGGISSNGTTARTILNAITFTGNATLGDVTNTGKLTFSADAALGGATRTLTVNSDAEFSGIISSTGAFGITKAGFGNLILSGANSYSGTTSINAGTLAGTQTSGTPLGTGAVTLSAGILSLAPTGSGSAVSVTGGTVAAGTLFTYNAGATLSLNRGSQSSLTYTFGGTGATTARGTNGTLILSTSNIANFGAAGTNLERFIMNGTAPTQVNTLVSGVVIQDRNTSNGGDFATYDATNGFTKASYTHSNTFTGSTNVSRVEITSATSTGSIASYAIKANATVTNSGTITLGNGTNPAALILNGGSISGGTLASAAAGAEFLVYTSGSSSISSAITTSTSGMSVFGPGSLTLSSSNSFTGGLRVNNSTLIVSNDNQLGGANNALTLTGGTLQTSGASLAIGAGARAITLAVGQDKTGGTFDVTSGTTTFQNNSTGSRIISGSGSLTKTGTGILALSGNTTNTYTGGTLVNQGTLRIDAGNMLADTGNVTVGGGTFDIQTFSDTVATVTLTSGSITGTSGTLTGSSYAVQSGSVSANLGGSGALTKSTAGTVTLTGANTYSGLTTVSAGKLLVNNTTGSGTGTGTVNVGASGTLGGTGAISGAVNVTGQLSPGASIETLATGTLSMANGSTLVHELDSFVADAVGSDLLEVTGNLNLTGTVYLTLEDLAVTDAAFAVNDTFSLINYTGTWNNGLFTFGSEPLSDEEIFTFGLNTWKISYNDAEGGLNYTGEYAGGTDSFVNLTAVTIIPEPGAALLGGLGILLILRRRR